MEFEAWFYLLILGHTCRVRCLSHFGFENLPKPTNPWARKPTSPWTWLKISPIPTLEISLQRNFSPMSSYISLSPAQFPAASQVESATSCVFPNKYLLWGLLYCVTSWYFLTPNCQDTFPFWAVTLALVKPFPQSCNVSIMKSSPLWASTAPVQELSPLEFMLPSGKPFPPCCYTDSSGWCSLKNIWSSLMHMTWM